MGKVMWTDDEVSILIDLYAKQTSVSEIAKILDKTNNAITQKAYSLGISNNIIKKNNPSFVAIYQDYDWCYERYINKGMTYDEMSKEANCSLRVIQKWCNEKYSLNARTFKKYKKLSETQKQLIMFSLLGDGHIDKRKDSPIFVVCHAENQKDYLFWKYELLRDLCASEPTRYEASIATFGTNHAYKCKLYYRFGTRIINDLIQIRSMSRLDIINSLNEFGIAIHLLDDGCRSKSNWQVCVAAFTEKEKSTYIKVCEEKLCLTCNMQKDNRYIEFNAESSRKIDSMILASLPNNLDIIKYKILDKKIAKPAHYFFVHTTNGDVGLARYCRENGFYYEKVKAIVDSLEYNDIDERLLIDIIEGEDCDVERI